MMTDEEYHAEVKRRNALTSAKNKLEKARADLDFVNKNGPGKTWTADLRMKKSDGYSYEQTTIVVTIPFGVIQQQMVDTVSRLEREIRALGGTP